VPTVTIVKGKAKHGATEEEGAVQKSGEGKNVHEKKRKRRKRRISSSSDQSEARIVDISSPKLQKDKVIATVETEPQSLKKLKASPGKPLKDKSTKMIVGDITKSPKKLKKLITNDTDAKSQKKALKKLAKKKFGGLSEKLKNKKLLSAFVESVTGGEGKSPLVRSSDKTKKSLVKTKLGRNKLILKGARKPAKRLKKSVKAKPV